MKLYYVAFLAGIWFIVYSVKTQTISTEGKKTFCRNTVGCDGWLTARVIILLYIQISDHYVVYLKLICPMPLRSAFLKKKEKHYELKAIRVPVVNRIIEEK